MRTYIPLSEREDTQDIIQLNEQETGAIEAEAPRRSPKRSAIYLFTLSYILVLLGFVSTGLRFPLLTGFLVVVGVALHMAAFLCLAWIEEVS